MTETKKQTNYNNTNHTTFGGYIYASDFNTDHRKRHPIYGSSIANRIVQDQKFDEQCKRNLLNRQATHCMMQDSKHWEEHSS